MLYPTWVDYDMASPYPRIPGSVVKQTQACPPFLCCQWWNSSGELEQGSRLSDSICIKVEFWPVWTSGQIRKTLWNVGKHVCFSLSGSEKISYLIQLEGRRKPEILNLERQRGGLVRWGRGKVNEVTGCKTCVNTKRTSPMIADVKNVRDLEL